MTNYWTTPRDDATGAEDATALFMSHFGYAPQGVWASPGRVNLIGEHVDYAAGISVPFALPHNTFVAARLNDKGTYRLVSEFDGETHEAEIATGEVGPGNPASWAGYAVGSIWAAAEAGLLELDPSTSLGMDLAIVSDVPVGSGLSSSAALECASAAAAVELLGGDVNAVREQLIAPTIRAENDVVGASTGGLDQTCSLLGAADHALALDFSDGSHRLVSCEFAKHDLALLVIDSNSAHQLVDGQYASRRGIIDAVTEFSGAPSFRAIEDVEAVALAMPSEEDDDVVVRRVRHVRQETDRAAAAAAALEAADFEEFGRLMVDSHVSLRDLYEVSTKKIDLIVDTALAQGALGARITGGGFGGSAIALVRKDDAVVVAGEIAAACDEAGLGKCTFHLVSPSAGTRRVR
ncbi:galactokinase [Corynebacterium uterequi]|uniref:Galactokinase n=1 Tax=Corynebacterium uterequi TaxID=1072256 RepID=A0A0G3HFE9_9CORY|nr:galactokinase [Corynebacterium uterequi]AKK11475.1 galactokinase [Corynebacterium uterequi]